MNLKKDKCSLMSLTREVNFINHNYFIGETGLYRENECKNLGVCLQSSFDINKYYDYIVNKAYMMLGFDIMNTRYFQNMNSIIYNALVRPHLEYATIIWSPQTEVDINLIDSTKIILRISQHSQCSVEIDVDPTRRKFEKMASNLCISAKLVMLFMAKWRRGVLRTPIFFNKCRHT